MEQVDHTLQLAEYLSNLRYKDLPSEVVLQAKKSLLNALGCGLGYALHPQAEKVFSVIRNDKRCPDATIIGRSERTSSENAALINGVAMTTADYDDTHLRTVIHPSGTPVAALLSYSEANHISGENFLLAFICGVEAQCAVGNALGPAHYRDGWYS
jgi:aconitate decarboxylase